MAYLVLSFIILIYLAFFSVRMQRGFGITGHHTIGEITSN